MADEQLLDRLRHTLQQHRTGISEYELMRALDRDPHAPFEKPDMLDSWQLFRCHFWLFHHLHLLRLELAARHQTLDIIATRICLYHTTPDTSRSRAVTPADPMQDYYLDLDNLERETPAGLQKKLDAFWRRLQDPERQQEDWQLFDLQPPVSTRQLRNRYRQLCQRYHPDRGADRGGDTHRFRQVQAAYARLKPTTRD